MCRQRLRDEVPAARNLALSCRHLPLPHPAVIFLSLILPFASIDSADRPTPPYDDNARTRAVDSLARADKAFDYRDAKLVRKYCSHHTWLCQNGCVSLLLGTYRGRYLSDSGLFISGALFTTDYLADAIKATAAYRAVDVAGLRTRLDQIAATFPKNHRTNESQTEDDFIWPVLASLGWKESLRQQNLTVTGRDDVPDGLLFADAGAKASANAQGDQWRRYAHGLSNGVQS